MDHFNKNFQKSPSAPLKPSIYFVIWPNCSFSSWLWWNWTSKNSYDVILVTSSPLRHRNYVTIFSNLGLRVAQWLWAFAS